MLEKIQFESDEADREAMYAVIDELRKVEHPRKFVFHIFKWFEKKSQYDLGSPSPFVHFIEEEFDYFDALVESIHRKPTGITVWMANRIANRKNERHEITFWIDVLKVASAHSFADDSTVESAREFAEHQTVRLALT